MLIVNMSYGAGRASKSCLLLQMTLALRCYYYKARNGRPLNNGQNDIPSLKLSAQGLEVSTRIKEILMQLQH